VGSSGKDGILWAGGQYGERALQFAFRSLLKRIANEINGEIAKAYGKRLHISK